MSAKHSRWKALPMFVGTAGDAIPPPSDGNAAEREEGAEHPTIETWIDYYEERVDEQEASALQEHLLSCRPCIDLLLELESFNTVETSADGTGAEASRPASFEQAATWRALRSALRSEAESPALARYRPRRWQLPHTLAASFFVAMVGLSALNLSQHRQLGMLEQQVVREQLQPNMAIHDLLPGTHRSRSSGARFEVPAESSHFTLILNLDQESEADQYRVVFVDSTGEDTLQVGGLKPVDYTLTLGLSRQLLPEGEYTVKLFDADADADGDEEREPTETYQLVLVYQEE